MNCPICGCVLPQGAQRCPACGTPLASAGSFSPGYGAPAYGGTAPVYPQNASTQNRTGASGFNPAPGMNAGGRNGFPAGYRQVYGSYSAPGVRGGAFLQAMANLPRVVRGLFSDPGETLRGMMEREDRYTGAVVAGLTLILTFLAAILVTRGMIASVFSGLMGLGVSLAGSDASFNQGVNYIAGKMAMSAGGIAALCQLFAMLLPAAAALTYLCLVRKVRFSYLLTVNLLAIVTLPSVAAGLLSMLFSLLSPMLAGIALFVGEAASYVLLCALLEWAAGLSRPAATPVKVTVVCASVALKALFFWLVGGALASGLLHTAGGLIAAMGDLL